jgi:hypothetical protein
VRYFEVAGRNLGQHRRGEAADHTPPAGRGNTASVIPSGRRAWAPCSSGRGILDEALDTRDEVAHPCGRPRPAPRERGDIAGGERGGQGSRRCDAARPQFGQDGRQAGSTSVSAVGLGLAAGIGASLDHLSLWLRDAAPLRRARRSITRRAWVADHFAWTRGANTPCGQFLCGGFEMPAARSSARIGSMGQRMRRRVRPARCRCCWAGPSITNAWRAAGCRL